MKRIHILLLFLISILMTTACTQWRVSEIQSKEYLFIRNGNGLGEVDIAVDEYAMEDLSFGVGVFDGKVCVADNNMKRIQLMDSDADVELVIGNLKNIDREKVKTVSFSFSTIGSFVIDEDDNLYVQNRFPQANRPSWSRRGSDDMNFSPSFILVFNKEGKLQHTLGRNGDANIPFYYIDSLRVDEKGRLFVLSRSFDSWSVYRFNGKKRDFFVNLGTLNLEEKEGDDIFKGKIENVKVYRTGEMLLISVAYYHEKRLKYRKVYDYSIEAKKIVRTIVNIPDAKNVLFNVVDDKHIYFWNVDNGEVKFMICNMEGHIENNIKLGIDKSKYYYSKIIGDDTGHIYSYHVNRKGISVMEWE
jgi:hypothetical protein